MDRSWHRPGVLQLRVPADGFCSEAAWEVKALRMAPSEDSCCRWSSLPVCLPSDKHLASPTLCQELEDRHKVDEDPHSGTLVSRHGNKWQHRARKASWAPGDSGHTDSNPPLLWSSPWRCRASVPSKENASAWPCWEEAPPRPSWGKRTQEAPSPPSPRSWKTGRK